MARRSARRSRRRAAVRLALFSGLVVAAEWRNGLTYWEHHHVQVALVGLVLLTLSAGTVRLWWMWRHRIGRGANRRTCTYEYLLDVELVRAIAPHVKVHDGQEIYVGISNAPELRDRQHAGLGDEPQKWWYPIAEPMTVTRWYPNRRLAKAAETRLITKHCPVGNRDENPEYYRQTAYRTQLQTVAEQVSTGPLGRTPNHDGSVHRVIPGRWRSHDRKGALM